MAETELNFFKSTKTEAKEAEETKIPQETKEEVEELTPKATFESLGKSLNKMEAEIARIRLKQLGAEDLAKKYIKEKSEKLKNLPEDERRKASYENYEIIRRAEEETGYEPWYHDIFEEKTKEIEGPFFEDMVTLKINIEGGAQANALASGDPRNFADEIYRNLYSRDTFDVQKWSDYDATKILSGLY